jgi:hypothetical protein
MHFILIGLLAAFITLAGIETAHAGPLIAAIVAIAQMAIIPGVLTVGNVLLGALSLGVSLLAQSLLEKEQKQRRVDPGIKFEVQMGDTVPVGFPIGSTATAGSREYVGSWGNPGGTPNAYFVDVLTISDIPLPGQPGLWIGDTKCTILWGEAPVTQGYPIQEFRREGKDYAWVKYHDGTQTTADSYLVAKFGTHPERPWTSEMIGRGCAYLIVTTASANRTVFPGGEQQKLIEPPVSRWYDVRKDSTAGGSGDHRWGDWDTYEPTLNNAVISYNIKRGVYYGDEWIFGGQNLAAFRLPAANWIAGANACDEDIDLSGGGDEPAYRCGMYVTGELEPLEVIEELRKACNATIAEDGGIFRIQVGEPGSAVYAFTDDDILVTEGQSYEPFPNIDNTNNVVEAVYPDPREMWREKDAPQRRDEDAIEEDGGRELIASVRYVAAPYPNQVQRLMDASLKDERRFRIHSFTLPPDAWAVSAGTDRVSWTSARTGYSSKKFKVLKITGRRNSNQVVLLKEVDAADFDWSTEYELPESVGVIGPVAVPAQPMTGWQAFPDYIQDASEGNQRPTIRSEFASGLEDVRAVRVQARVKATGVLTYDGNESYEDLEEVSEGVFAVRLNGVFPPSTLFEVRGKYIPISDRDTQWSEWLEVTTPSVADVELGTEIEAKLRFIDELPGRIRQFANKLDNLAGAFNTSQALTEEYRGQQSLGIASRFAENFAATELLMQVFTTFQTAFSEMFLGTFAETSAGTAESLIRFTTLSDLEEGMLARIAIQVRASTDDDFSEAGLELAVVSTPSGLQSVAILGGDQVYLKVGGVSIPAAGLQNGTETREVTPVDGILTVDLTEKHVTHVCFLEENVVIGFPIGGFLGLPFTLIIRNQGSYTIDIDATYTIVGNELDQPVASPGVWNEYTGKILSFSPPVLSLRLTNFGATSTGTETMFGISPPLPTGESAWNLDTMGPLEIDGLDDDDVQYVFTPLGERLDCEVELWGPGGTSGSVQLSNPADPDDGTDTTFVGSGISTLTAGAGKPSPSVQRTNPFSPFGAAGVGGTASGGDTNTNGNTGGNNGNGGETRRFCGRGAAAPNGGAQVDPLYVAPPTAAIVVKHGVEGNSPGGGARGCGSSATTGSAANYHGFSGGGGSGAYVKQTFDFSTPLVEGVPYTVTLGHPSDPILAVSTNPAQGKRGGRSRIRITAL